MAQMLKDMVKPILPILIFIVQIITVIFVVEFLVFLLNYFWFKIRGLENDDGYTRFPKPQNILLDLLWRFPRQIAYDRITSAPGFFRPQGLIVFCGRQGSGKTVAMTEYLLRLRYQYPLSKTLTNYGFTAQDGELKHWRQLLTYKNGIYGVIVAMDELQNWFSSLASKDFPPEMLEVITQNRKNRRVVLGTSQTFNRLAKPLREQCTEVRDCRTFMGCLTLVTRKYGTLDVDGNVAAWTPCGWYFFVHTKKIRDAYDTYRIVETLSERGFYENSMIAENRRMLRR